MAEPNGSDFAEAGGRMQPVRPALHTASAPTSAFEERSEDEGQKRKTVASNELSHEVLARRDELDDLLSGTFNSILRIEEKSLQNKLTAGLTITEVHTIVAVGLHECNPMNVVAARLGVTLATLTTAVNKLVAKGFIERTRDEDDRRRVLVSLTKRGKQVFRAHGLFHRAMIDEALADLTDDEERIFAAALTKVKRFFDDQAEHSAK